MYAHTSYLYTTQVIFYVHVKKCSILRDLLKLPRISFLYAIQWIGLGENPGETIYFPMKY